MHLQTRNHTPSTPQKRNAHQQSHLLEQSPDAKSAVDMTVKNIASGDLLTASSALSQVRLGLRDSASSRRFVRLVTVAEGAE